VQDNVQPYECMTQEPPHFFDDKCFDRLDWYVKQATDAGVWAVVTALCATGAGGGGDVGQDYFHNDTLRGMFFSAWAYVSSTSYELASVRACVSFRQQQ
jgi:hypothetical protein